MEETTHSNFNKFKKFQQPVVTLVDEIKKLSDVETNVELVELIDDKFFDESQDSEVFRNELDVLNYFAVQLAYSPDLDKTVAHRSDLNLLLDFFTRGKPLKLTQDQVKEFSLVQEWWILVNPLISKNKILTKFSQQIKNYSLTWEKPPDLSLYQASMIISKLVALGDVPVALIWLFLRNRIKPDGDNRVNLLMLIDYYLKKRSHFIAIDGKTLVISRNPINNPKLIPVFSGTINDFSKMNNLPSEIVNFYELYKDYLNALACNLVYAKCASRLTRVDKLYQKEMSFRLGEVMIPLRAESVNKNRIVEYLKDTYVQQRKVTPQNSPDEKYITRLDKMIKIFDKKPASSNFWDGDYTRLINQFERESATRLNIPKYNKSTMPNETNESRNSARDSIIKSNEIIENNISDGISFYPLIVNGDAGMGKTISIHQIAMNYLDGLIEMTDEKQISQLSCLPLPIFLKARRLQSSAGDWLASVINGMFDSLPDLIQYISPEDVRRLIDKWSRFNRLHKSHLTYFVDALDECESKSLVGEILENAGKLSPIPASQPPMIIASTRPSHYQTVRTALGSTQHLIAKMDPEDYYTERELSDKMPQKLCDAWGMTHEPADGLKENLDKCKALIRHPLFVGWICYLLSDKELDESLFVDDLELSQNNIFSKIIDIGIKSSLNRNEVNLSYLDEDFDKIIRYFVALSYHYSLEKPADVFKKMRNVLGISVSKVGKDVIRRDCGILFLTGKNIEFTHKTIQEVIYADLFDELSDNFHIGNLRADKPVLSRLAQVRYDGSNPIEIVRLDLFSNHLENEEFESKVLEVLWDIENKNVSDRFRSEMRPIICLENDELKPIKEDREEIEIYIAQKYIDAAKNKDPFKLPDSKFRSDKGIREAIYDLSSHPFGTDMIHFSGYYDEEVDGVLCVKGNLVSADYLNLARVNKYTTSLVDVFRYIKTSSFTEPAYGITETDVLSLLTAGMKNRDIKMFDLQGFAFSDDPRAIHGVTEFEMDDIEFISFFWEITGISLPKTFESQCKVFRNSLTHACYALLFGSNFEERINVLWNEASDLVCMYQTGYGENSNAEQCNLISALLDQIELNPYRDLIHEDHPFPANLVERVSKSGNNENLDLKAVMLFPLVYESLKIIKSGVDPYGINPGINEFLDDAFVRSKGYFRAFELVKAYSDNILKK